MNSRLGASVVIALGIIIVILAWVFFVTPAVAPTLPATSTAAQASSTEDLSY